MEFEYNARKSRLNKQKHGIDFEEAQALWEDDHVIELPLPNSSEERWLTLGKIEGKHWSAVTTYRGSNVRIISVRRSRDKERRFYEEHQEKNYNG